jgi:hypothetical protein
MYYSPPPPQIYNAPPDYFYKHGYANKPQSAAAFPASHEVPSKTGFPNTIKNQEETHKVPSPLEETVTSNDDLNARAANSNPAPYFLPQELPPSQFYGSSIAYNQHLPGRGRPNSMYHPSSASPLSSGQSINKIPETPLIKKFGPAALTCSIHDFEHKEPKESIALLQLYLKPNPNRHNSFSERAPKYVINSAEASDVRETEAKSEVEQSEQQQDATRNWYQGQVQVSSPQEFYVNAEQRPGMRKELNQEQWWSAGREQVWDPQQTHEVPADDLLNEQLLTNSHKNGLQAPGSKENSSLVATERGQRKNGAIEKQLRLEVVRAKLLQEYQSEAEKKQQRGKQATISTVHKNFECTDSQPCSDASRRKMNLARHSGNISDSKEEDMGDSGPTNKKPHKTEIPADRLNSSAASDEPKEIEKIMEIKENRSNQTARSSCENSSCPEEGVTYMKLQNGSSQEGNINRESTIYPEEIITYILESTTNLKTSVTESQNNIVQNSNKKSTEIVPDIVYNASTNTDPPATVSKKGYSQSPLKVNSAEVRTSGIQKVEFSSTSPSRYIESEMATTSKAHNEVTSMDSSDMMTTTSFRFVSGTERDNEVDMANKASLNSEIYSKAEDKTETPPTKTKSTDSRHSEDGVIDAGTVTPSDILVSSVESDMHLDSFSSDTIINSDSHKMDVSDEEAEHAIVNNSNTILKNAVANDSLSEITDKNVDFFPIKNKSFGSTLITKEDNKFVRTGAGKLFRSDIMVSSIASKAFNEANESTSGVNVNSNEPRNSSLEPVTAETLDREMTSHSDSVFTSDNPPIQSAETMQPEVNVSSHGISSKQSWNSNNTNGEMLSADSSSSHEISSINESKDTNSSDFKKYRGERKGDMKDSQTPLTSIDASSSSSDFQKSDVFMQNQSTDYATNSSFDTTESTAENGPTTEFAERETPEVSDAISVTTTDGGGTKKQMVSKESSSLENSKIIHGVIPEERRDSGFMETNVFNTTNSINKKHTEVSGMRHSQKTGSQMKFERGLSQAAKQLEGYPNSGSFQNSEISRNGMYPQFRQVAPPGAMQFLVYPNSQNPHSVGNIFPQPYIYPSPLTNFGYPVRYNSNIRSRNGHDDRRKSEEAVSMQSVKDVNDHRIEGELPLTVILQHK